MAGEIKLKIKGEDLASNVIKDISSNLDGLSKKANNLNKSVIGPLNNALGTGLKVAAGVGAAGLGLLAGTIVSGVSAASDMEQKLADISAAMGTSAEETQKLNDLIINLGLDPTLKVDATEAANAIQNLGLNGLTTTQILNGAAKSTVLLANATGADFGEAANIATDVMNLFAIKAEDMADAVNGISSVTVASKFGIDDYALALAQAGGVASTVGVDFDDFNATIASISPYFASGSDAGTSFKTFLQRLVPSSNEAIDAMRDLGLFTGLSKKEFADTQDKVKKYQEQLVQLDPKSKNFAKRQAELTQKIQEFQAMLVTGSNAFFDTEGNLKSMADITQILHTALGGLSEEQKNEALSTIFGSDAMRAAAAISKSTKEDFLNLQKTMGNTDAQEQAAKRMDTFKGALEILMGTIDAIKLQIGQAFLPILKDLVNMFTKIVSDNGPAIQEMFKKIADKFTEGANSLKPWIEENLPKFIQQIPTIVEGIGNVVGQLGDLIGKFITAAVKVGVFISRFVGLKTILTAIGVLFAVSAIANVIGFISAIVGAISAISGFVGALGSIAIAISPIGLVIGAIILAIGGLYYAWKNNLFGIQDITKKVFGSVVSWFTDFPTNIGKLKDALIQGIKDLFTGIPQGTIDIGNIIFKPIESVTTAIGGAFTATKDYVVSKTSEIINSITGSATTTANNASGEMQKTGAALLSNVGIGAEGQSTTLQSTAKKIIEDTKNKGFLFGIGEAALALLTGGTSLIIEFIKGINFDPLAPIKAMIGIITALWPAVSKYFTDLGESLSKAGSDIMQGFWDALNKLGLVKLFTGLIDSFSKVFGKIIDGTYLNQIVDTISQIPENILKSLTDTGIIETFSSLLESFKKTFYEIVNFKFLSDTYYKIRGIFTNIYNAMQNTGIAVVFNNLLTSFKNVFTSIINGQWLSSIYTTIRNIFVNFGKAMSGTGIGIIFYNLLTGFKTIFYNIINGQFIKDAYDKVRSIIGNMGKALSNTGIGTIFYNLLTAFTSVFYSVINGDFLTYVFTQVKAIGQNIYDGITNLWKSIIGVRGGTGIVGLLWGIIDAIAIILSKENLFWIFNMVNLIGQNIYNGLINLWSTIIGKRGSGGILGLLWGIIDSVSSVLTPTTLTWIFDNLKQVGQKIYDGIVNLWNTIIGGRDHGGMTGLLWSIIDQISVVISPTTLEYVFNKVGLIGGQILGGINSLWSTIIGSRGNGGMMGLLWSIIDSISSIITSENLTWVFNMIAQVPGKIWDGLKSIDILNSFLSWLGGIWTAITSFITPDFLTNVWNKVKDIGKEIINGIIGGFNSKLEDLRRAVENGVANLPQWVKDLLHINSPPDWAIQIGSDIMEGLSLGVSNNANQPKEAMQNAMGGFMQGTNQVNRTINNSKTNNWNINFNNGQNGGSSIVNDTLGLVNLLDSVYGG